MLVRNIRKESNKGEITNKGIIDKLKNKIILRK
jgi:hypothetical protein